MTFLQNELLTKNEIIKSLTETQTTILEALSSFKSNQQCQGNQTNLLACQKQHKSPPPTPSKQQKPTHHNDKSHSKYNECLQSSDKGICHGQKTEQIQNVQYPPKQKIKQTANSSQTQTLYIGNLSDYTTEDDLYELFGLRSTKYLKQNCSVKMSTNSNTGKKKYFAYVTAPEHVTTELIKLNGIEFNSKCIIVEEAKNKPTAFSEANALRPTSPVFGNHLTDENQSKLPIGSAKKTYSETVRLPPNSSNTLIFTDSIAKGIRMYEFNRFVKNSKAKMFSFPGASSHQMLHYLDVHLEERQINTVVIHVGINDILRDSSQSSIDGLLQNIKNMALKCTKFGVKNIFISGLVYTTRINIGILEKIHVVIQNLCQENGWFYVDNRNIRGKHLYKDGLHLMEEGKIILARNLIFCLNKGTSNYFLDGNFLNKHTHHSTVKI